MVSSFVNLLTAVINLNLAKFNSSLYHSNHAKIFKVPCKFYNFLFFDFLFKIYIDHIII